MYVNTTETRDVCCELLNFARKMFSLRGVQVLKGNAKLLLRVRAERTDPGVETVAWGRWRAPTARSRAPRPAAAAAQPEMRAGLERLHSAG